MISILIKHHDTYRCALEINRLLLEMSASHMLTLGRCNSSRFDHKSERRMNCSIILQADGLTSLSKNTIYKNKQETLQSELNLEMKNLESSIFYDVKCQTIPFLYFSYRHKNKTSAPEVMNTVTPHITTFSYENRHQQQIQPNEDTFLSFND